MQPQYPAHFVPHDENLVHPKRMPVLAYPRPNPFRLGVVAHGLPPLLFSRLLHRHNNAQSGAAVAPGDESRLTEVAALIAGLEAEGRIGQTGGRDVLELNPRAEERTKAAYAAVGAWNASREGNPPQE